jgi:hypothetical protein
MNIGFQFSICDIEYASFTVSCYIHYDHEYSEDEDRPSKFYIGFLLPRQQAASPLTYSYEYRFFFRLSVGEPNETHKENLLVIFRVTEC